MIITTNFTNNYNKTTAMQELISALILNIEDEEEFIGSIKRLFRRRYKFNILCHCPLS